MAYAEKCPVCGGKSYLDKWDDATFSRTTCHGCDGKGWVEVGKCEDCPYAGLIISHIHPSDGGRIQTQADPPLVEGE